MTQAPKTVLVISSKSSQSGNEWEKRQVYAKQFYTEIGERCGDVRMIFTTYDALRCQVVGGHTTIREASHDFDIAEAAFVHFKNWVFNIEIATTIAFYLRQHNVPFYNTEVDLKLARDKFSQMVRLAHAGVHVPDTFYCLRSELKSVLETDQLPEFLSYPLIIKDNLGSKGNDNFLVHSSQEALEALDKTGENQHFVVQNFLPNDGDYRLLFIGLDDDPLVFIRRSAGESHLNNTSQGGSGEFVEASSLPDGFIDIARHSAEVLGREIGGVDILVDRSTGLPYVLEVNSTPALATGYGIEEKQRRFAAFLQKKLRGY